MPVFGRPETASVCVWRSKAVQQHLLEQYHHLDSLVHRLDPRLKLLAVLAFVLAATSIPVCGWPALLPLAALISVAILAAHLSPLDMLKRSAVALPFVGMAALSLPFTRAGQVLWAWHPGGELGRLGLSLAITDEGLRFFAVMIVKAWLSVLAAGLLVATTPFAHLLQALNALHVPAILTTIISFMVRYLFVLTDEAMRMQMAREARSAGRGGTLGWRIKVLGGMIGSLFIRSFERSERIYAAMLSRGFAGQAHTMTRLAWQARDGWVGLVWGMALAAITIWGQIVV